MSASPDEGAGAGHDGDAHPEITIESIANGGDGVGHLPDGRVVFVPRTTPGDRLRVKVVQDGGSWARGYAVEALASGPDRREAPCPVYARCGGCQLQHMRYRAQLEAKAHNIHDALTRIGKLEVPVPEVEPSPSEFHYRNRLTFTMKRVGRDRVVAGFHAWEEPGRITEVWDECLLAEEPVVAAWTQLRAGWAPAARRLPSGRELRLTLRAVDEGVVLAIEGGSGPGSPGELLEAVPALVAVWHRPEGGAWRHVAGTEVVHDSWFGEPVALEGAAFLQVNRELAQGLHRAVLGELGNPRGQHVVDAYAGLGLYARRLAAHGARVTAIESDPRAVARGRSDTPDAVTWVEGRVEDELAAVLPAERLIVNPPRAGLHDDLPPLLRTNPVPRIVYVSCDPATLARDLERLGDAYEIRLVRGFDLFPQTAHVETMVVLDATGD